MMLSIEAAKERAFQKCNLIGENVDVFAVLYQYKVFREMSDQELDKVYDDIVFRLGFLN